MGRSKTGRPMGRPKVVEGERITTSFEITKAHAAYLDERAAACGCSKSSLIRWLLDAAMTVTNNNSDLLSDRDSG